MSWKLDNGTMLAGDGVGKHIGGCVVTSCGDGAGGEVNVPRYCGCGEGSGGAV